MHLKELIEISEKEVHSEPRMYAVEVNSHLSVEVYSRSVNIYDGVIFFIARANTQKHLFLLGKHHYVDSLLDFVCCGKEHEDAPRLELAKDGEDRDFPSRDAVTYSYRVFGGEPVKLTSLGAQPLLADMNPHFERLPNDPPALLDVRLGDDWRGRHSINHGRRGQNVSFADGHVSFERGRRWGRQQDDVYTIRDTVVYHGSERPADTDDAFLGP